MPTKLNPTIRWFFKNSAQMRFISTSISLLSTTFFRFDISVESFDFFSLISICTFYQAIQIIETNEQYDMNHNREFSSKWAPLLHNIGSTYRKLNNYEKSIEYHERALAGNSGKDEKKK